MAMIDSFKMKIVEDNKKDPTAVTAVSGIPQIYILPLPQVKLNVQRVDNNIFNYEYASKKEILGIWINILIVRVTVQAIN